MQYKIMRFLEGLIIILISTIDIQADATQNKQKNEIDSQLQNANCICPEFYSPVCGWLTQHMVTLPHPPASDTVPSPR